MKSVVAAHDSLVRRISDRSIMNYSIVTQDKSQEVKYTRNMDFNDEVALSFLNSYPGIEEIAEIISGQRKTIQYINPFYS